MALIRSRARRISGGIFTTSMADIVFLLTIFFILTSRAEVDRTKVDLPKTWVRQEVPKKAAVISISGPDATPPLVIRVSNGEELANPVSTDEEVVTFVANVVSQFPGKQFVIKADRDVPYERVDSVLDALKRARAREIFLLSDQKTVGESRAR